MTLHQKQFSLDHAAFCRTLSQTENLLIIQDLDGVCMELVQDPLTRNLYPNYIQATTAFAGHFYVLTNGEHIGRRGVQGIVERTFGDIEQVKRDGLYLPGLAGGGVQWQDRQGNVSHPGVSNEELAFLAAVPQRIETALRQFFKQYPDVLSPNDLEQGIRASVLDNLVSPTANLNTLANQLRDHADIYLDLQKAIAYYAKALQLNPEYAEAYYNLGAALLIQGQTEKAIGQLRNALQFRKDYAEAFYTLGVAQVKAGQKQEAIQSFIQAQAFFNQQKNIKWAQQSDRQIQRLRSN